MKALKQKIFGREQVIGLDINDGWITAAWFRAGKAKNGLKRFAIGQYNPEASDRQIARAVRDLWRKEKMPTRTVQTCLRSRSLLIRYFQYENLNPEELPNALALEAEEALQLPASKISMDWQLSNSMPDSNNQQFKKLSGVLSAAPREKVMKHRKLIKLCGLYTINVHTSCSATSNLYSWLTGMTDLETIPACLINLTKKSADIIMHSKDGNYPRTLFSAGSGWAENIDYLLENIQNILLYYHLKLQQDPVEKIVLAGCLEGLDRLPTSLAEQTGLPVNILNINEEERITKKPLPGFKTCNRVTAIGLGLRREEL